MATFCDVNDIRRFFEEVSDRSTFHLCRIDPKKDRAKPICENFVGIEDAIEWIVEYNSRGHNIYEQYNAPGKNFRRKAKRDDVLWLYGQHLDWDLPPDCEDELAWLEDAAERASTIDRVLGRPHIIMTGNGIQCRWPFAAPMKATDDLMHRVENINARILQKLGAQPGTHNVDRILRVPGTTNWPNAKKKKAGRKPIMAEIWQVSQDDFTFGDFEHLPVPPRRAEIVDKRWRIDYTARDYENDQYEPVSWEEIVREDPLIETHVHEMLTREGGDRSRAAYGFLQDLIRAMAHILNEKPEDWLDDPDIYKNLSELLLDAVDASETVAPLWGHFEDQPDPLHKLGYDIRKTLLAACDGEVNTLSTRRKADQKKATEAALAVSHDELTPHEHRREFVAHMRESMQQDDLPNLTRTSNDVASVRQQATESNVREIFLRGGVLPRWNAMRDEVRFDIKARAGRAMHTDDQEKAEKRITAPRHHFHRALQHTAQDSLSAAQESLIMDALHERGITARRDLSKLFEIAAKENRYHPIADYCQSREWDGEGRIAQVASCLTSNHPLKELYIRIFFRQCVAAVKSLDLYKTSGSGEMLGSVPILVGPQRMGKTSFWRMITPEGFRSRGTKLELGGYKESDNLRKCLSGLVTILDEIGAGLDYSEQETVKNFLTDTNDEFRVAYANWPTSKPRMTVFVGTSNELHLKDASGSRRFLAMDVTAIDFDKLNGLLADPGFLQQCYAEAWHEVMIDGAIWWLDDVQDDMRARENAKYNDQSEEESAIESYFNTVDDRYEDAWLTITQFFRLIGVKYSPHRARRAKDHLQNMEGCEFKEKHITDKGHVLYRVWKVPTTYDGFLLATGK